VINFFIESSFPSREGGRFLVRQVSWLMGTFLPLSLPSFPVAYRMKVYPITVAGQQEYLTLFPLTSPMLIIYY